MRILILRAIFSSLFLLTAASFPSSIFPSDSRAVSPSLFQELEELSRLVDISYCVGSTGIHKPFECLSRCSDFVGFELVTTWNTGPLLSDSCGYIALSHLPFEKRIIVAFRGTYSIANTIVDLSTNPAEYVPFPGDENVTSICTYSQSDPRKLQAPLPVFSKQKTLFTREDNHGEPECRNCTMHSGFLTSWTNTRCLLIPHLEQLISAYPNYKLTLVGHSLGGAVAAIAALEFQARGWEPHVTTFGEPRIGNQELNEYFDKRFDIAADQPVKDGRYRRVTHVQDPVPLLPLEEWGYRMHAGEIYISKRDLSPDVSDLEHCVGDEDPRCISGTPSANAEADKHLDPGNVAVNQTLLNELLAQEKSADWIRKQGLWPISPRYRLWELFFAHRDYFWRLGLCVPGGDPKDWWRKYPDAEEGSPRVDR